MDVKKTVERDVIMENLMIFFSSAIWALAALVIFFWPTIKGSSLVKKFFAKKRNLAKMRSRQLNLGNKMFNALLPIATERGVKIEKMTTHSKYGYSVFIKDCVTGIDVGGSNIMVIHLNLTKEDNVLFSFGPMFRGRETDFDVSARTPEELVDQVIYKVDQYVRWVYPVL